MTQPSIRASLSADDQQWDSTKKKKILEEYDTMTAKITALEERTRSYKLDSNTPTYSGNVDENLTQWIVVIKNAIKAANVPKEMQFYVLAPYLKGQALQTYIAYQGEDSEVEINKFLDKLSFTFSK